MPLSPSSFRPRFSIAVAIALAVLLAGCTDPSAPSTGRLDTIWSRFGLTEGRFQKPRAITIDAQDRIYVVDWTARIQAFDRDGNYLRGWQTPIHENGRPVGLGVDREGRILVPDTHYFRVLIYSPEGQIVQTIGGTMGHGPGEFGYVTDVVQDSKGCYYVAEYGEYDRIQKFTREGEFVRQWGNHGNEPGQFVRPQALAIDAQDRIWVADACNHRIQVFDTEGVRLFGWGEQGAAAGQICYPYGIALDGQGHVYVCEYGNHRVQKFTLDGKSLGCFGKAGHKPGEFFNPWGVVIDRAGRVHVLDTNNHRVQRIFL